MVEQDFQSIAERIARLNSAENHKYLWEHGYTQLTQLFTPNECQELINLYSDDSRFDSSLNTSRNRSGEDTHKFFRYPLPEIVEKLREHGYRATVGMANQWNESLGINYRFPSMHAEFIEQCRNAGQRRLSPQLLCLEAGGYSSLHQNVYGRVIFPLQMTVYLSERDADYTGGEFVIAEHRPRAETTVNVLRPKQGTAVIFTARCRPAPGTEGVG